jgi:glyoxylase-like metal-dependent hydrolase (beta-lactamase superfamily II)
MSGVVIHEVSKEFFSIRSPEEDFHRNIHIKRFRGNGAQVNMIFDPGTKVDIPNLMEAADQLIGGLQNIHLIFLSHQDPDVSSNTPALLQIAPSSLVIASIDTWRLVKMYGIHESRFRPFEGFRSSWVNVKKTGHRVQFLSARFCHFRGALMCYDPESGVLFTGDFLGGTDSRTSEGIWADEDSWEGISLFHQIYMPSSKAVKASLDRIARLNPMPDVIAPQHGDPIRGDLVPEFISRLGSLKVGLDLLDEGEPQKELAVVALNAFLDSLKELYPAVHGEVLKALERPQGFTTFFNFTAGTLTEMKVGIPESMAFFWKLLEQSVPVELHGNIQVMLTSSLDQFSLPSPRQFASAGGEGGEMLEASDAGLPLADTLDLGA